MTTTLTLPPHGFLLEGDVRRNEDTVRAARSRARARITVAPGAWLSPREGVRLEAGQAVDESALDPQTIEQLRQRGVVLVLTAREFAQRDIPRDASHVVMRATTSSIGILTRGRIVGPSAFARPAEPARPATPPTRGQRGELMAGEPAVQERPAIDGRDVLRDLERRGVVRKMTERDRTDPPPIAA